MKRSIVPERFISAPYVLCAIGFLCFFASCQKEAKSPATTVANSVESTAREAQSISSLTSKLDTTGLGLVAWFSFDSGSLRDVSSNHNRIIFNNAELTTDRNGVANNAYHFNGNGSYMAVKNSPSLNPAKEITLFAIARYDDFYAGKCHGNRLLNKGYPDGVGGFYTMDASDNYYTNNMNCSQDVDKAHEIFEIGFHNAGAADTTEFIQMGHWYHIVYTYGDKLSRLYVDGKLVESVYPNHSLPGSNSDDLYIGTTSKPPVEYPYWFAGSIDQIGIFNKALTPAQVAVLSSY